MAWRDNLRSASFRGVTFKVETGAKVGGRRGINFEFPKRDTPKDEDLGKRSRRWAISGYVIGDDYDDQATRLEAALDREGPGLLVHPTMGEMQVRCETYARSERKTEGRIAVFDMTFVEAPADRAAAPATQSNLRSLATFARSDLGTGADQRMTIAGGGTRNWDLSGGVGQP